MRKDVKIIMAVCVIVLVGLIVYALFMPGEKKSPVASTENTTDNSVSEVPTTEPTENTLAVSPTTAPSEIATSPTPTASPTAAAPTSGDWNKLLSTGSSTPDTASPMTSTATPVPTPSRMPAMSSTPSLEPATPSSIATETTATSQRTYTVKSGDTPTSIAQAEYGNGHLYTKILAANPKLNARHMHVGQKIILPDLSAAPTARGKTSMPGSTDDLAMATTESPAASASSAVTPAGPHYTVVAGDNLQHISTKLYGSSAQWEKIYDLNKSKIGSNPARLRVGMVLELPKAPTATATPAAATR